MPCYNHARPMFGLGFGEIRHHPRARARASSGRRTSRGGEAGGQGLRATSRRRTSDLKGQFEREFYADDPKPGPAPRSRRPPAAAPVPAGPRSRSRWRRPRQRPRARRGAGRGGPGPAAPARGRRPDAPRARAGRRPRRRRRPRRPARAMTTPPRSPGRGSETPHRRAGQGLVLRPPERAAYPARARAPRHRRSAWRWWAGREVDLPVGDAAGDRRPCPRGSGRSTTRATSSPSSSTSRWPSTAASSWPPLGALPALALRRARALQAGEVARVPFVAIGTIALLLRRGLHLLRGDALRLPGPRLHRRAGHEAAALHAGAAHPGARR